MSLTEEEDSSVPYYKTLLTPLTGKSQHSCNYCLDDYCK